MATSAASAYRALVVEAMVRLLRRHKRRDEAFQTTVGMLGAAGAINVLTALLYLQPEFPRGLRWVVAIVLFFLFRELHKVSASRAIASVDLDELVNSCEEIGYWSMTYVAGSTLALFAMAAYAYDFS